MEWKPFVESVARRVLGYGAVALAGHGIALSDSTQVMVLELVISAVLAGADVVWSMYDKYVRQYVKAKLEIMTATAQAQAEALRKADAPAPTAVEIAERVPDPKVTASVVAEVMKEGQLRRL